MLWNLVNNGSLLINCWYYEPTFLTVFIVIHQKSMFILWKSLQKSIWILDIQQWFSLSNIQHGPIVGFLNENEKINFPPKKIYFLKTKMTYSFSSNLDLLLLCEAVVLQDKVLAIVLCSFCGWGIMVRRISWGGLFITFVLVLAKSLRGACIYLSRCWAITSISGTFKSVLFFPFC